LRVEGLGLRVEGRGLRNQGLGFRVEGLGFGVNLELVEKEEALRKDEHLRARFHGSLRQLSI